ncbi:ribbon-helix-helix domain-containing protein [Aeribacillus composti]|uniref:ribbon-helix-helix domain-containing protein n=1 Tax=Aeribacillus composti TaxID=1868734 RepID=UPI003D20A500
MQPSVLTFIASLKSLNYQGGSDEMANDERIYIRVPKEMKEDVQKIADRKGVTVSNLLKMVISEYIEKNK